MPYTPMPGPHPGEQFVPSNGFEGDEFIGQWCCNCARDKALREGIDIDDCDDSEKCEIVAASFRGEAVEWRITDEGDDDKERVFCIAFVPAGQSIPAPRCEHTCDLFAQGEQP